MKIFKFIWKYIKFTGSVVFAWLLFYTTTAVAQSGGAINCFGSDMDITSTGNCQYGEVKFTATQIPTATYAWDINSNGTIEYQGVNLFEMNHVFSSTGTFQVTVSIVNDDCTTELSTTVKIVSASKPVFDLVQTCDSIQLINYSVDYDSIMWVFSDGHTAMENESIYQFKKDGKYDVTLIAYRNACSTKSTKEVLVKKIKLNPSLSSFENCAPAVVAFDAGTNNADEVKWYLNDSMITKNSPFNSTFSKARVYRIAVSAVNSLGCSDTFLYNRPLFINPPIKADFEISNDRFCVGMPVSFTDKSLSVDQRTWNWGNGESTTKAVTPVYTYSTAGTYDITLTVVRNEDGCKEAITKKGAVQVYQAPIADFSISETKGCLPFKKQLENHSKGEMFLSYFILDGVDTMSLTNTVEVKTPGHHEIELINVHTLADCRSTKSIWVEVLDTFSESIVPRINTVTNINDSLVKLVWMNMKNAKEYAVYKSEGGFSQLAAITSDTTFSIEIDANDSQECSFYIIAFDQCGHFSGKSRESNLFHVNATYQTDSLPTLRWSEYQGWETGVAYYDVQHNTNDQWTSIGQTNKPFFIDRNFDNNESLSMDYRIVAHGVEMEQVVISNSTHIEFKPNIFIPSAFTPNNDNLNDQYKITAFGFDELTVMIFNKWGEQVFENKGNEVMWDGTHLGDKVETGTYLCIVKAKAISGQQYELQETVTLIR